MAFEEINTEFGREVVMESNIPGNWGYKKFNEQKIEKIMASVRAKFDIQDSIFKNLFLKELNDKLKKKKCVYRTTQSFSKI